MSQNQSKKTGAVLVVGGGISGMQSALDLAETGYKVYLVEQKPAIGGTMAMLDKTFPTNDCAMCTMSPKLVDTGRHLNVEIITNAEVLGLEGEPGNFKARVLKRARCVIEDKCIACGACAEECPIEVPSEFDGGLGMRKAIYKMYAQATPNAYAVDKENCIECGACEDACEAGAIDHDMEDEELVLEVGSVILSPGFEPIDPTPYGELGWGIYQNVLTSVQFERMLSASGPFQGHVSRPSDQKEPKRIAFVQCVGSRDVNRGKDYCSAVCCMYATKQAIIAKEHIDGLDATIFYMDIRAYGKDFEKYYDRARLQNGVRYEKSMISSVKELQQSKNLLIRYRTADGELKEEEFDMLILSVGLKPSSTAKELAEAVGVELDEDGFCRCEEFNPSGTTRPGVYAGGAFVAPKDIPETVGDASCAAAQAARILSEARGSLAQVQEFPPEKDVLNEDPRVGAFICNCGINIGSVVKVPEVVEYAKSLPGVVHAEEFLFTCSQDNIDRIKERIKEHKLNRVMVASCTPRTHAPLFMSSIREAGLNPYLYEQANIREHASWVHRDNPEAATEKAKDLVRMAVAKVKLAKPVHTSSVDLNRKALVVGGGLSGLTAALNLANQGFGVYVVERKPELGGNAHHVKYTIDGSNPQQLIKDLSAQANEHPLVEVFTGAEISEVAGYLGNYKTTINIGGESKVVEHGAVIIATGAQEAKPNEYLYGENEAVLTQRELEDKLANGGLSGVNNVVMIQCVGSRQEGRPYCSRICCTHAIKNALKIKKDNPDTNVVILYRDIRTYGLKERYYRQAREQGVVFVRYELEEKPQVSAVGDKITVSVTDPVLKQRLELNADLLVLSTGIVPESGSEELSQIFKVPLNADGFYSEAHMKLRPVDFAADGLYLCGLAHSPKLIGESLAQANAAAIRAVTLLSKDRLESLGIVATVNEKWCKGCGLCVSICPYDARVMDESKGVAGVREVLCQGCGACVAACPSGASQQNGFEKEQIIAMVDAAL
ncbi:CoB--CoM heterodisulfide reductase iron-sulfur subunit A family protein [Desulfofalx alkaliphila]|uniref:CoB--CoM heterodisulfide reductase iron-sulfur subunit A family protein n=1 Tax=Desulfofalx alkaliphila TaxID=105483 RepID=UPI0004E265CE|nr:CoB--CoM heterodisulfide reductase iron-sulfur subunit A family protein [Desulfofalx alkaliphila]